MSKLYSPMAVVYDQMIDWDSRLKRELPLIREVFSGSHRLLDLACATGRHAIALADQHEIVGVDISEEMIGQAKLNAKEMNVAEMTQFYQKDMLDIDPDLAPFDGGYILANSLANLASRSRVVEFLRLMRDMIPEGNLMGQTVNLPNKINYLPLRFSTYEDKPVTVQRIMIPVRDKEETHHLHFNLLSDAEKYLSQSRIPLYGFTPSKFRDILNDTPWQLKEMYSTYNKDPVREEVGSAQIWILE